jgi:hypothetical protein
MAVSSYYPGQVPVLMGLAADTKPVNVPAGSKFIETDTGKTYMLYNTASWVQVGLIPLSGWTDAPAILV